MTLSSVWGSQLGNYPQINKKLKKVWTNKPKIGGKFSNWIIEGGNEIQLCALIIKHSQPDLLLQ